MHLISSESLYAFVHSYGLIAVFFIVALESSGLPLPGEATLLTASVFAATTHELSIVAVIACAAAGAIAGDNLGFLIGRTLGLKLLIRHGARIGLDQSKLKLGQYLFRRHGGKIIFFGRFIAVLRALAAVLAGANAYPWDRFLVFNATGGVLWATLYGTGAYIFGRSIHKIAGPVGLVVLIAAVLAMVMAWRFIKSHEASLQAEAERAFPGPLTA
jgi:membrane protein DedA with SNARE-associated domain